MLICGYALYECSLISLKITISQEDYNRLPGETRNPNREKITTEKSYKKEKSKKYLNMQVSEKRDWSCSKMRR